ncbi:hypothetical protein BU24DRAFT_24106 [Aaosphaeria arxii CBS 175.79]|uniref:Uncharacterized protein n=1 Tax=Aaosphaeria arxii CBS 175.79 TaxID=1450172 RepID=A0A6A5YAK6_9PLEO|nr:uncharacterized protein BU24DRAFT_24106 [Aaosphaeria arxii CBS 175.79]KAF2021624.1 hypothetical protein BU24DRAFT_24106 [Aaosphaeria arxii CBS 175.79]
MRCDTVRLSPPRLEVQRSDRWIFNYLYLLLTEGGGGGGGYAGGEGSENCKRQRSCSQLSVRRVRLCQVRLCRVPGARCQMPDGMEQMSGTSSNGRFLVWDCLFWPARC